MYNKHYTFAILGCYVEMSGIRKLDAIVTEFLLNTCRICPLLTDRTTHAALLCGQLAATQPVYDVDDEIIPLTTGSVAEFYIEPMLPCVGDIDVMYHYSTCVAIPRGHPPPTQLPAEFHNYVQVHEIIDSHLPGYVYLELRYLLTQCIDDEKYNAIDYDREGFLPNVSTSDNAHGPAVIFPAPGIALRSLEQVFCIRCLMWLPQAADWPTRPETTAGQTQQLLIVLLAMDVMWLVWHIVSVDNIK